MGEVGGLDGVSSPTSRDSAATWPFPYKSKDATDKAMVSPGVNAVTRAT